MVNKKKNITILNGLEYEEYSYYGKTRYRKVIDEEKDEYGNVIEEEFKNNKKIQTKLNYNYEEMGDLVVVKIIFHPKKFKRYEFGKEENLVFPPQLNYLKRVLKFGKECFENNLDIIVMGFNNSYVSLGISDDDWLEINNIKECDDIVNVRNNSDIKYDDEIHPTKLGIKLKGYKINNKIEDIVKSISLFGNGCLIEGRVYYYNEGDVELWVKNIKRKNYIEEKLYQVKFKPKIMCEGFMYLNGVRRDENNIISEYMKSSLDEDDWVDLGKCYKKYHSNLVDVNWITTQIQVEKKESEFKKGLIGKKYNPNSKPKGLDKFFK